MRRHRLIERFLTDVLGVPWDEVHEEAERLEHAMSPVLEERMLAAIGDAKTCPHGHPIVAGARLAGVPLADVEVGASVRVLRFENEAEDLLHYLKASGLEPGLEACSRSAIPSTSSSRPPTGERLGAHRQRRRDGVGDRRPLAAAAHRPARAARARAALRALERAVGLGEPCDAGVDLLGGDARVGQAQRVLAALQQEVGALHERHPALAPAA